MALPQSSAHRRAGATGEGNGTTAPPHSRDRARPDPCAPSGKAGYTNPKGAGQNLSQTMLRHLTVGSTVGSVVILRYQTQPCIARRASTKGALCALCGNSPFSSPHHGLPSSTLRCFSSNSFHRTRLSPPEKARGANGHFRRKPVLFPLPFPPNVAPPATLENALLELLVAATKTLHKGAKPEG